MNQGLFESLSGHFKDGTPVESVPVQNRRILSIMDHLNRLFNSRIGSLSHLCDYGLPDISQIYRKMPQSSEILQKAIKTAIEKFEPRLKNVRVFPDPLEQNKLKLAFIICAEIHGSLPVRFQTTFTNMGTSSISPCKKTEVE